MLLSNGLKYQRQLIKVLLKLNYSLNHHFEEQLTVATWLSKFLIENIEKLLL